jgi:hypothetical protein
MGIMFLRVSNIIKVTMSEARCPKAIGIWLVNIFLVDSFCIAIETLKSHPIPGFIP